MPNEVLIQYQIYFPFPVPRQQGDDCGEKPFLPQELPHRGGQHLQDLVRGPQVLGDHVDETGTSPSHRGGLEPCQVQNH